MGDARMIHEALFAAEPHALIPPEQRIFAPFIGSWALEVTWRENGAPVRREPGEWHFAWVLEGRGIQDVWIVPPRSERATHPNLYEYGSSMRFYDPELEAWRSTWIGPMHGMVRTFIARGDGAGGVKMESDPGAGPMLRWVFSDVAKDSFVWRNFEHTSDGWTLIQDFKARRVA